ncbi:MAG TPA: tyrosine-type recombinase/integrase, partial [Anaeromyxobacteraceae bacterium]|nr:tyrosine-type recombinase/integrase [Anaeromyxobacteraceae bacterium]
GAGGTWGIRWREGARRCYRGGFATRELAERVLARVGGELAVGRAGLPRNPRDVPTLGVLAGPWLDSRDLTHRAASTDRLRWHNHVAPWFAHLRPAEVDAAIIRRYVEAKLAEGLAGGTVRILVSLLSALYSDLVEQGLAQSNPARALPRATRRLARSTHDPRTTPFVEKLADVRRIYLDLRERHGGLGVAYAIGAMAGLRTGEVFGLRWEHVDLDARRIHVRESVTGPLKDKDSRVVPILDGLLPVLKAWKLKTGGEGRVVPPLRRDGTKVDKHTPGVYLRAALDALHLARPGLGWYEATRHTFASQWVLAGGSIEKLSKVLGHYSVVLTERYVHLRPDLFATRDLGTIPLDLGGVGGGVPVELGQHLGSTAGNAAAKAL